MGNFLGCNKKEEDIKQTDVTGSTSIADNDGSGATEKPIESTIQTDRVDVAQTAEGKELEGKAVEADKLQKGVGVDEKLKKEEADPKGKGEVDNSGGGSARKKRRKTKKRNLRRKGKTRRKPRKKSKRKTKKIN